MSELQDVMRRAGLSAEERKWFSLRIAAFLRLLQQDGNAGIHFIRDDVIRFSRQLNEQGKPARGGVQ